MSTLKKITAALTAALVLSLAAGCATQAAPEASSQTPANASSGQSILEEVGKLSVYASFYPMYDFAAKVGGDRIKLTNMMPAGTEAHDWEPTAADIAGLEKADVFIYNGSGMESWADKVLSSLQNKDLIHVEASHGIELIEGHHHHDEDEDEHTEEHEDEEHSLDPHVWVGIRSAKQMMENIKNALVAADPDNATYYEENYAKYAAEFDKLDKEFTEAVAALPSKTIVVSHQAFGYLCHEYGLTQMAVEGLTPDSEPDAARMVEIIRFCRENNVKTIYFEELASPKVAETISRETGAKVAVLSPVESLTKEQAAAGDDYLSVMRINLKALVEGQ